MPSPTRGGWPKAGRGPGLRMTRTLFADVIRLWLPVLSAWPLVGPERGIKALIREDRVAEIGAGEVGVLQARARQISPIEMRVLQLGAVEKGVLQRGLGEVGVGQVRLFQIGAVQVRRAQIGPFEACIG